MKSTFSFTLASALTMAALMTGCSSLRTVTVTSDPAMAGASVAVDVIPITPATISVEGVSIHDYWQPGNPTRQSSPHDTLRFGAGQPAVQSVTKDWKNLGVKKVVVIADLPGVFTDAPGDADPRRKTITVGKDETVSVRLFPTGLLIETH